MKEAATELLFGGHETTASTATSLVMFLGLNSEVVQKVREEIQEKVWSKTFNFFSSSQFDGTFKPMCGLMYIFLFAGWKGHVFTWKDVKYGAVGTTEVHWMCD